MTWTYAEALDVAEHVARGVYAAGALRVTASCSWPSELLPVRPTWWGDRGRRPRRGADQHQLRGRVPAPPAERRPGPVRGHRRRDGRAVGRGRRARAAGREVLGDRHRRWEPATRRSRSCARTAGQAAAWEELEARRQDRAADADARRTSARSSTPPARPARPRAWRCRTRSCTSSPRSWRRLTRLTPDDAYLTTTPLFHGNATFMAVYPVIIAGGRAVIRPQVQRQPVDRPRPRLRRHRHQLRRRDDGLRLEAGAAATTTATTSCGASTPRRRRARSSSSSRSATASRRSSTRSASPRPARRSCRRTGCRRPAGAAGLAERRSGSTSGWSTPRPTARSPVGEVGELVVRPGAPVDVQQRLLQHAGEDRRGLAEPVVPHRRRAAPRRGRLVLLRRPLQGRAAPARREHQLLRGRAGRARPPGRRRGAVIGVPADQEAGEDEVLAVVVASASRSTAEDVLAWCTARSPPSPSRATCASSTRCRRRRRRRSASRSCATRASPPTPTTGLSTR